MSIIPAINCRNWLCVSKKLKIIRGLKNPWVQFDIVDGKFAAVKTWGNKPSDLLKLKNYLKKSGLKIKIEVHLMVENPLAQVDKWLRVGAKRIIVPRETISEPELKTIVKKAKKTLIGLAINPETPIERLLSLAKFINFFQILAVKPGKTNQKFQPAVLKKIKTLRKLIPKAIIEVDGGINLKTAQLVKNAGADILVSASYIFDSKNPQRAYGDLAAAVKSEV